MQRVWELAFHNHGGRMVVGSYRTWEAGADAFARWLNRIHVNNSGPNPHGAKNTALGDAAGRAYDELASKVPDMRKATPRLGLAVNLCGVIYTMTRRAAGQ